jgi:rRNA-processing protein FCF1
MILCYEPIKNIESLGYKFGKTIFLIHPLIIKELNQIKQLGAVKRSKIANLALEIIEKETKKGNFMYFMTNEIENYHRSNNKGNKLVGKVDLLLLNLALKNKYALATIDKNLITYALKKGANIVTLKNNKIVFVNSYRSDQI